MFMVVILQRSQELAESNELNEDVFINNICYKLINGDARRKLIVWKEQCYQIKSIDDVLFFISKQYNFHKYAQEL